MCPVVFIVSPPFSFYFSTFLLFLKERLVCCHDGQFVFLDQMWLLLLGFCKSQDNENVDKLWKQPAIFFSEKG